jgi:putative ABC transport system ATP-binding protein
MTAAVACRDLFKVHRTPEGDTAALQGLTLEVRAGEIVVCLGPSGSGKSTLLRVLAGLEAPSAGTAAVLGHDLGRLPPRRRAALRRDLLGSSPSTPRRRCPGSSTCSRRWRSRSALRGTPRREAAARAHDLLEHVGLADRARARPGELSGGERQRASVAAALAHRPDCCSRTSPRASWTPPAPGPCSRSSRTSPARTGRPSCSSPTIPPPPGSATARSTSATGG